MRARRIYSNTSSFTSRKKEGEKVHCEGMRAVFMWLHGCLLILLGKYGFISPLTAFQHHRPIAFVFWCFINDKLVITQRFWRNERISCTFINSLSFFSRKMKPLQQCENFGQAVTASILLFLRGRMRPSRKLSTITRCFFACNSDFLLFSPHSNEPR